MKQNTSTGFVSERGIKLRIEQSGSVVTRIDFIDRPGSNGDPDAQEACRQLREYLAGTRKEFTLEFEPAGTLFQMDVWNALCAIPYGETRSYGEIAAQIGRPLAARAVGQAAHRNPLPILIPCHRLIGKNGSLTGFAGGTDLKAKLLALETEAGARK